MTKIQTGIAGAIVVAGILTPLVMQHRSLNSLRAQNFSLQQQVEQAAQLRAENQRMSNVLPAAESSQSLPPDLFSELLRLRGEAGVQKSERGKLWAELAARRNSAASLALRTPASGNYYPKGSWAIAGNATPEAALQSMSWAMGQAMSQTNLQALLALVGPEMQAEAARHFAGKSDSEIATEVASEAATFAKQEGFRLINKKIISEDEVVLTFYIDGPDGFGMMAFKRTGEGWKVSDTPKTP